MIKISCFKHPFPAVLGLAMALLLPMAPAYAAEGESLYQACVACHGADAAGNAALGAPALAGQQAAYLERQLKAFRDGQRGAAAGDSYGAQMQPFAQALGDETARGVLVTYLSGLESAAATQPQAGDTRRGANLYNGNCGACHGGRGEGNEALQAPRLAGLDATYLARQMDNFREGRRGYHEDDRLGRQMAMMARTLPDEAALTDVIAYLVALGQDADTP